MTARVDAVPGVRPWPQNRFGVSQRGSPAAPWRHEVGVLTHEPTPPTSPLRGVQWSPFYVAFLLYIFVITTYQLPIGNIAMAAALGGLLFQRQVRLPALLLWLGLFLVWSAVGYVSTRYPAVVWEHLVSWGKVWLVALVAANALRSRSQIRFFIIVFLGCFALYPLRGALVNYYVYHEAVFGRAYWNFIYSNPNDLAALALLQLSMIAGLLMTEPKGWVRCAVLAGTGFLPLLILMTQSRGVFIALCVFTVCALFGPRLQPPTPFAGRRPRRRLVALALVGVIVSLLAPTGVWQRVRGLKEVSDTQRLERVDPEGSARGRFEVWKLSARIIADHPVRGVGLGAYRPSHESYTQRGGFDPAARGRKDAHSTLLTVTGETGFPGLLLFLALVISPVLRAERIRRKCRVALPRASGQLFYLEVGLATFFVAGIFASYAHLSFLYVHLALLWAMAQVSEHDLARLHGTQRTLSKKLVGRPALPLAPPSRR
jgi:O-antigen ligase